MSAPGSWNAAAPQTEHRDSPQVASGQIPALLAFVTLTFGWTWTLWIAAAGLASHAPGLGKTLLLLAGFGPSFCGLITVWIFDGRVGLSRWLHRCLNWRLRPIWYAVAFIGPLLAMILAVSLDAILGGTLPSWPSLGHARLAVAQVALVLVINGPLGEEFGWRGYALHPLTARMGWRWAGLIVGAVWGLWHLPLFFIPGMAQAQMPIALFMSGAIALSVLMARIAVNTAFSVLPALTFHWAINAGPAFIPIMPGGGQVRPYVLVMGLLFAVASIVLATPGPRPTQANMRS
jgi:membrane protease YdiL (CAAX protease family)